MDLGRLFLGRLLRRGGLLRDGGGGAEVALHEQPRRLLETHAERPEPESGFETVERSERRELDASFAEVVHVAARRARLIDECVTRNPGRHPVDLLEQTR